MREVGLTPVQPTVQELQSGKELFLPVKLSQSEPFEDEVNLEPTQVRMKGALVRGLPKKKVPVNVRLTGKPSSDFEVKRLPNSRPTIPRTKEDAARARALGVSSRS